MVHHIERSVSCHTSPISKVSKTIRHKRYASVRSNSPLSVNPDCSFASGCKALNIATAAAQLLSQKPGEIRRAREGSVVLIYSGSFQASRFTAAVMAKTSDKLWSCTVYGSSYVNKPRPKVKMRQ